MTFGTAVKSAPPHCFEATGGADGERHLSLSDLSIPDFNILTTTDWRMILAAAPLPFIRDELERRRDILEFINTEGGG